MKLKSALDYEEKWAERWADAGIFEVDPRPGAPKIFICVPYSYQNAPLHVGHGFTYTRGDVYARFKRMQGYNVLFPWAWHWTGEAVAGTSERLKRGDQSVRRMLIEIDGVPEELLDKFTDPAFVTKYYTEENRETIKAMGLSIDWRREFYTTDLHPYYSKFIEWQYVTLRDRGYIAKGRHPVVWCPRCESPTGDHDRLVGEGVSPEEYTLVYFRLDDAYLAAATLRPETIFGVTNLWINPNHRYLLIEIYGKKLIVSRQASFKLENQMGGVNVLREISADELVGKFVEAPLTGRRVPILPADLVDPNFGSGVVYSVPAHAPYDYAGIIALRNNMERITRYGLEEIIKSIRPISIIRVPGYGEFPAVEEVERLGITSDTDPRLEEATRNIYSKEFHEGVLKENCGEYSGKTVAEARELVKERLIELGLGGSMWELPERVLCRCGTENIVKIVEDQWFLKYSDAEWKAKVKDHIMKMNIYPEEARKWFLNVVDWLRDWACARKTGLGTKLPWDPDWIVETLSDSTIYPALYTISKYLNLGIIEPKHLNIDVFNYIYLGLGDLSKISSRAEIPEDVLKNMRDEFLYWYPVDMRISAKELVPNHLTFYIFHHTAIFEPRHWPRGIGVNGMVKIEGEKMSKSKGNFIPLKKAIELYGADTTRATLLLAAEDLDDPDWRDKNAREVRNMLELVLRICRDIASTPLQERSEVDDWLLSILQRRKEKITYALERLKTRTALSEALYGLYNDWRWYVRRINGRISAAAKKFIEEWIKLLAPFTPFTAEECWSILGKNGFISLERWPEPEPELINECAELKEELLRSVMEDVRSIIEVYGKQPNRVVIYVASGKKKEIAKRALEMGILESKGGIGNLVKWMISEKVADPRKAPTLAKIMVEVLTSFTSKYKSQTVLSVSEKELEFYRVSSDFLSREFGAEIMVYSEDQDGLYDPMGKASNALPLRPGIFVE